MLFRAVIRLFPGFLALLTPLSVAFALQDNSFLTGNQQAVGNDGALETVQNPAYLAFPKAKTSMDFSFTGRYTHLLKTDISNLKDESVSGSYQVVSGLGFAYHGLFSNSLHFGLVAGNGNENGYGASDSQDKYHSTAQNIAISSSFDSSSFSNFSKNQADFGGKLTLASGGLGMAWKISDADALGLSAIASSGKVSETSAVVLDGLLSGTTAFQTDSRVTRDHDVLQTDVILGYVSSASDGDIAVRLKPFQYAMIKNSASVTSTYSVASAASTTVTGSKSYEFNILQQPKAAFGFSQFFTSVLKTYIEAQAGIPWKYSYSEFDTSLTGTIENDIIVQENAHLGITVGLTWQITPLISASAGVAAFSGGLEKSKDDKASTKYEITISRLEEYRFSGGVAFFDSNPWYLFLGGEYCLIQNYGNKTENSSSNVLTYTPSTSRFNTVNVSLGARYRL